MAVGNTLLLALGVSLVAYIVRLIIVRLANVEQMPSIWIVIADIVWIAVALYLMAIGGVLIGK